MGNVEIVCSKSDSDGNMIRLGIKHGSSMFVETIIYDLRHTHVNRYFVKKDGQKMEIYAKQNPLNQRWFLTTDPDGIVEGELGFLPQC